jgi:uncharacterized membrane protein
MIKLLGILVVAVGFGLRVNALVVVLVAGLVTGLSAGFPLREVVALMGKLFVENRGLILPIVLMLPAVGLLEKHGLREHIAALMRRVKRATPGGLYWLYQAVRGGLSVLGISLGTHAGTLRPLLVPMAEGVANKSGELPPAARARLRAHAAAAENVGNFFSDDLLVAVGALLLVTRFFDTAGVPVTLTAIQVWSAPTAVWALVVGWWRYRSLDRWLTKQKRGSP